MTSYTAPGAAPYGNFNNYYQFNPAAERLVDLPVQQIVDHVTSHPAEHVTSQPAEHVTSQPAEHVTSHPAEHVTSHLAEHVTSQPAEHVTSQPADPVTLLHLDVGCNTGELTVALRERLQAALPPSGSVLTLGVDIDPVLITRCRETHGHLQDVTFTVTDMTSAGDLEEVSQYLLRHGRRRFDLVTCFSVTMWVHLQRGDAGLRAFLRRLGALAGQLIVEPQAWPSYTSAVRRHRKLGHGDTFPRYRELAWREAVAGEIRAFLTDSCGLRHVTCFTVTKWKREVCYFTKCG